MSEHSFVVMTYKDSPYLKECIESLRVQTVPSHIILSTSTPTEKLRETALQYNLPLSINKSWTGMASDWNFGLMQAKTEYVTLAHQDDLYLPEYTERCLAAVKNIKDTLICFTDYHELAGDDLRTNNRLLQIKRLMLHTMMPFKFHLHTRFWKKRLLSFGCPIAAPTIMCRREALSGFQFSSDFMINIDWDAWSRMAQMKGSFVYVPEPLVIHRIHQESATTIGIQGTRRQQEDLTMFRRFWPAGIATLLTKLYSRSYKSNVL